MKKIREDKKRARKPSPSFSYNWQASQLKEAGSGKRPSRVYYSAYAVSKTKKPKEAEVSSSVTGAPLVRANKKKESRKEKLVTTCRFLERGSIKEKVKEADQEEESSGIKVCLIQEGLGNTHDGFYYTREALQQAADDGTFEGKKAYADHPAASEEQDRPERSVRDIIGHYENVSFKEGSDGAGQLVADFVPVPGEANQWARDQIQHAKEYAKKYPDKDFIGLSINASGDAVPVEVEEFLTDYEIVPAAKKKVEDAIKEGLTEIKVVNKIDDAVSCDLVTEAGAKGKILEADKMANKAKHKESKNKEEEAKAKEAKKEEAEENESESEAKHKEEESEAESEGSADSEDGDADHGDEEQDKELILKMLKKQGLLDDDSEDEHKEHAMKAAKHYMQAYVDAGHDKKEAMSRGVEAMKCAGAVHEAMNPKDGEGDADDADKKPAPKKADDKQSENHKESKVIELTGKVAKLEEALRKRDVADHLEKKLKESKLPVAVTKKFREAVKAPKSIKEIDEKLALFVEAYSLNSDDDFTVSAEKQTTEESESFNSSLEDCVEKE